jgi:hypothetical protein
VQIKTLHIPVLSKKPLIEECGNPVSRRTAAWIGYDEKNLYAMFVCDSPPGQMRARVAKREDVFSETW